MRAFAILTVPLLLQVFAYLAVFMVAQGGGSFMGLLAMPVAAVSVVVLLVHGVAAVRRPGSVIRPMLVSLAIALLPPMLLLVFRALES